MQFVLWLALASMEIDFAQLTRNHFMAVEPIAQNVVPLYIPSFVPCGPADGASFAAIVRQQIECRFALPAADVCNATHYVGASAVTHVGPLPVKNNRWDVPNALMGFVPGDRLLEVTIRVVAGTAVNRLCNNNACAAMHTCKVFPSLPPICVPDAYSVPTEDGIEGVVLALATGAALVALVASSHVGP